MFEYAEKVLNNYDDKNYTHYNESYHPKRPGVAYFDKHVQPSGDNCVGSLLASVNIYYNSEINVRAMGNGKLLASSWAIS